MRSSPSTRRKSGHLGEAVGHTVDLWVIGELPAVHGVDGLWCQQTSAAKALILELASRKRTIRRVAVIPSSFRVVLPERSPTP
jgi:hypothetical protein